MISVEMEQVREWSMSPRVKHEESWNIGLGCWARVWGMTTEAPVMREVGRDQATLSVCQWLGALWVFTVFKPSGNTPT